MGDERLTLGENTNGVVEVSKQGQKLVLGAAVGKDVVGEEQGGTY